MQVRASSRRKGQQGICSLTSAHGWDHQGLSGSSTQIGGLTARVLIVATRLGRVMMRETMSEASQAAASTTPSQIGPRAAAADHTEPCGNVADASCTDPGIRGCTRQHDSTLKQRSSWGHTAHCASDRPQAESGEVAGKRVSEGD